MKMKIFRFISWVIVGVFLVACGGGLIIAGSVQEMQTLDGAQRNRLETSLASFSIPIVSTSGVIISNQYDDILWTRDYNGSGGELYIGGAGNPTGNDFDTNGWGRAATVGVGRFSLTDSIGKYNVVALGDYSGYRSDFSSDLLVYWPGCTVLVGGGQSITGSCSVVVGTSSGNNAKIVASEVFGFFAGCQGRIINSFVAGQSACYQSFVSNSFVYAHSTDLSASGLNFTNKLYICDDVNVRKTRPLLYGDFVTGQLALGTNVNPSGVQLYVPRTILTATNFLYYANATNWVGQWADSNYRFLTGAMSNSVLRVSTNALF